MYTYFNLIIFLVENFISGETIFGRRMIFLNFLSIKINVVNFLSKKFWLNFFFRWQFFSSRDFVVRKQLFLVELCLVEKIFCTQFFVCFEFHCPKKDFWKYFRSKNFLDEIFFFENIFRLKIICSRIHVGRKMFCIWVYVYLYVYVWMCVYVYTWVCVCECV